MNTVLNILEVAKATKKLTIRSMLENDLKYHPDFIKEIEGRVPFSLNFRPSILTEKMADSMLRCPCCGREYY